MDQQKEQLLRSITKEETYLSQERFSQAEDGTHYHVFLSEKYVVRARQQNREILIRESELLKQLEHPLIPNVIQVKEKKDFSFMVENRLPGSNMSREWKKLSEKNKNRIAQNIIDFLEDIHQKIGTFFYDIQTGNQNRKLYSFLIEEAEENINVIENSRRAQDLLTELKKETKNEQTRKEFEKIQDPCLVHGDMIIHNLLTDGEKLTGVIDWELARWSDPDHDAARLLYYRECARSYYDQGRDESLEYDFLNKIFSKWENKINEQSFQIKYNFYRSLFYLKALTWAVNSNSPDKNIKELEGEWVKNKTD